MTWRCKRFGCRPAPMTFNGKFQGWGRCVRRACRMYDGTPPATI